MRWTCKSTTRLAAELVRQGHPASQRTVCDLLITADCGGSNGHRLRLWKLELQSLADELRLALRVCHFPPGTSKWNKIEHRMFCHITQTRCISWRMELHHQA